jgi:hypothetical protein
MRRVKLVGNRQVDTILQPTTLSGGKKAQTNTVGKGRASGRERESKENEGWLDEIDQKSSWKTQTFELDGARASGIDP